CTIPTFFSPGGRTLAGGDMIPPVMPWGQAIELRAITSRPLSMNLFVLHFTVFTLFRSHLLFVGSALVSDLAAACRAKFTGDVGAEPVWGVVGNPRCANNSMARVMGMWATPVFWSQP